MEKKIYPAYLFWRLLHDFTFFSVHQSANWLLSPFSASFLLLFSFFKELSVSLFLLPSLIQHLWEEKPITRGSGINSPFRTRLDTTPISLNVKSERGSLSLVLVSLSSFQGDST